MPQTSQKKTRHKSIDTQRNITQAARKLFIKQGFKHASMESIAEEAGVNHSLIYYHFKTKDNLWAAVKALINEEAQQKQPLIPASSLPFDDFLKALLQRQLQFYQANSDVRQMITLQRLENKKPPKKKSDMAKAWIQAIEHYQQQGAITRQYSPAYVTCFILSVVSSIALDNQPILADDNAPLSYLDTCFDMIKKGLST